MDSTKGWAKKYSTGTAPPEGAEPATFSILNKIAGCSRDARHAYAADVRIKDVDPNKFPAEKKCISCDESGVVFEQ